MTRLLLAIAVFALVFGPGALADHEDRSTATVSAAMLAPTSDPDTDGLGAIPPGAPAGLLAVALPLALGVVLGARRSWSVMPLAIRLGRLDIVPASISRRGPPTFVS